MAYDATKPLDNGFIADGPSELRENFRALKEDKIVDAGKLKGLEPGHASGDIPISDGTLNTGLNADQLDGHDSAYFSADGHVHSVATATSNGFMSSTDKAKLDGVAAGAEVNQNVFAKVKVGDILVEADQKQDTLELVPGSNVTITPDVANDKITIAVDGNFLPADGNAVSATSANDATHWAGLSLRQNHNTSDTWIPVFSDNFVDYVLKSEIVASGAAASAAKDSRGQQIDSTYIKSLSVNGRTVTYTRGNGTTDSFQTQDTNTTYTLASLGGAPKPQTAAGVGQWVFISTTNSFNLPSGGTWAYYWKGTSGGGAGIAAGGATISAQGQGPNAFAWRIA